MNTGAQKISFALPVFFSLGTTLLIWEWDEVMQIMSTDHKTLEQEVSAVVLLEQNKIFDSEC